MIFRKIWEWLGEESNLKRLTFLWTISLASIGGLYALAYWGYSIYFPDEPNQEVIVDQNGFRASPSEVKLRTALMLVQYGNERRDIGDYVSAEKSYEVAWSLVEESGMDSEFHYSKIMLDQIQLYKLSGNTEMYNLTSTKYEKIIMGE